MPKIASAIERVSGAVNSLNFNDITSNNTIKREHFFYKKRVTHNAKVLLNY